MECVRAYKHPKELIYIPNTQTWIGILAFLRGPVWTPRGASDGG